MDAALIAAIAGQLIPLGFRMYEALQPMPEEEQNLWIAKLQNNIESMLPKLGEITKDETGKYK